tara:strand:+ start:474 stop:1586 length:1113 start_codon:yes stop_codon:yes gene_type:complete
MAGTPTPNQYFYSLGHTSTLTDDNIKNLFDTGQTPVYLNPFDAGLNVHRDPLAEFGNFADGLRSNLDETSPFGPTPPNVNNPGSFDNYLDDQENLRTLYGQINMDTYVSKNANKLLRDLAKSDAEQAHFGRSGMDLVQTNTRDVDATTEKLKERVRNVIRLGEIQEYYNSYYDTKKSIIFETILVFFTLVVLYALKQNELLPESLFNFFFVVILFVFIFFRLFRNIADFVSRDKQYFDKYDWGTIDGSFNPVAIIRDKSELDTDGDGYRDCKTFVRGKSVLDVVNVLEDLVGAHNAENNSEEEKAIIKKIMRCMVNYVNGQYSKDQNVVTDAVKTKLESGRSPFLWGTINSITGDSNRILPEVYKTATAS